MKKKAEILKALVFALCVVFIAASTVRAEEEEPPLHEAIALGQIETVRLLIERGADINGRNYKGDTPLHKAVRKNNAEIAKFLIERGANITLKDSDGRTPLQLAIKKGRTYIAQILQEAEKKTAAAPAPSQPQYIYIKEPPKQEPLPPAKPPKKEIPVKIPEPRQDAYAIIIGIDYKDKQDVPELKYPSTDAKKIYDVLTDVKYGGVLKENATLLLNEKATRSSIKAALRQIKNLDGYIYVYYSGHGAPKTEDSRLTDAFIVPYDIDISSPEAIEDTAIKVSEIEALMEASQAKGIMVALDACFTGKGKSIVPKGGKPVVIDIGNLKGPRGSGKITITSSAANQQSWEDDGEIKGGIFSHYLIEALKGKDNKNEWMKVNDIFDYLKLNVPKTAKRLKGEDQSPQIMGEGNFAVTRNWERAAYFDADRSRERLKAAYENKSITSEQLKKALDELKKETRTRTLETFLEEKISEEEFGQLY